MIPIARPPPPSGSPRPPPPMFARPPPPNPSDSNALSPPPNTGGRPPPPVMTPSRGPPPRPPPMQMSPDGQNRPVPPRPPPYQDNNFPRPPRPGLPPPPRGPIDGNIANSSNNGSQPPRPLPPPRGNLPPPPRPLTSPDGQVRQVPAPRPPPPNIDSARPPPRPPLELIKPNPLENDSNMSSPNPRPPISDNNIMPKRNSGLPPPPFGPTDGIVMPKRNSGLPPTPNASLDGNTMPKRNSGLPPPPIGPTDGNIMPKRNSALPPPPFGPSDDNNMTRQRSQTNLSDQISKQSTPKTPSNQNSGFNTALLAKAQAVSQKNTDVSNDSDDGGWSDDENNRPLPPPISKLPSTKADNTPSQQQIKQPPINKPPVTARPPTVTKTPVENEINNNVGTRQASPIKQTQNIIPQINKPNILNQSPMMRNQSPPPTNRLVNQNQLNTGSNSANQQASTQGNISKNVAITSSNERSNSPQVTKKRSSLLNVQINQSPNPSPILQETTPSNQISSPIPQPFSPNVRDSISQQVNRQQMFERQSDKIKELEIELFELKKKLEKTENKLSQHNNISTISTTSNRESLLEKELDEAHLKIDNLKREKRTLELSIEEFQRRLTIAESKSFSQAYKPTMSMALVDEAIKREEREKLLENQLNKVRKDKEKAVKLIIQLIGKDRINDFMNQHAGSPDILDELVNEFSNLGNTTKSPNKKPTSNSMKNVTTRSRMDEYFKTVVIDHNK